MKQIIIKSQEELDKLPNKFKVDTQIIINCNPEDIIIIKRPHEKGLIIISDNTKAIVRDNATIQYVRGNATIQDVSGNATIQDVSGNATIQDVRDNATIQDVSGNRIQKRNNS